MLRLWYLLILGFTIVRAEPRLRTVGLVYTVEDGLTQDPEVFRNSPKRPEVDNIENLINRILLDEGDSSHAIDPSFATLFNIPERFKLPKLLARTKRESANDPAGANDPNSSSQSFPQSKPAEVAQRYGPFDPLIGGYGIPNQPPYRPQLVPVPYPSEGSVIMQARRRAGRVGRRGRARYRGDDEKEDERGDDDDDDSKKRRRSGKEDERGDDDDDSKKRRRSGKDEDERSLKRRTLADEDASRRRAARAGYRQDGDEDERSGRAGVDGEDGVDGGGGGGGGGGRGGLPQGELPPPAPLPPGMADPKGGPPMTAGGPGALGAPGAPLGVGKGRTRRRMNDENPPDDAMAPEDVMDPAMQVAADEDFAGQVYAVGDVPAHAAPPVGDAVPA